LKIYKMVGKGGRRWCPNGCGMFVYHYPSGNELSNYKRCYSCDKCNKIFTKKELMKYAGRL